MAQLVNAGLDRYLTWRAESIALAASYENWTGASGDARAGAFDAYLAALDREEQAASAYQHVLAQALAA
jgi:hypothetical protein